jgi:MFS family permease
VSSSWAAPDPRPVPAAPLVFAQPPVVSEDPPVHREVLAGVLTALAVLLLGPVVGLLWAALAPRADLRVDDAEIYPRDPETSAFIAGDGVFLAAAALAGVLTGLLTWRLARRYGLGAVVGLAVGGLAAAYVARAVGEATGTAVGEAVGELLGRPGAGSAAGAVGDVPRALAFQLRAPEALVSWPVGALLAFVVASVLARRAERSAAVEPQPRPEPPREQPGTDQPPS